MFDLPSLKDVLAGELVKRNRWLVASVVGASYWSIKVQAAKFRGQDIFILPPTREGTYPAVAARPIAGQSDADLRKLMSAFLSSLCWAHQMGAVIENWSGGTRPVLLSGFSDRMARTLEFELDYLPDAKDQRGHLALALCREAGGVNIASYAVITFFRVFETHFQGQSKQIKDWINANVGALQDPRAVDALKIITNSHVNVGAYLYGECRSAAAHGKIGAQSVIDPDDPEDELRLRRDLPLIRALAIKLTEEILGIQTTSTVFKEHLYELAGFKTIVGEDVVTRCVNGQPIEEGRQFNLPPINVGLMERRVFPSLCNLQPIHVGPALGGLQLVYQSKDALVTYSIVLDFKNERLLADGDNGVSLKDDGSVAAAEIAADLTDFIKFYNLNGRLRIDNAETAELIARKEAFIPVNVVINPDGFDAEANKWREEAEKRARA